MIQNGCGLVLFIKYANGDRSYSRTLLVIDVDHVNNKIKALNVSGLTGKEWKLSMPSNIEINNYDPPFNMPSFVKLDEVYKMPYFPEIERQLCKNGQTINNIELKKINMELGTYCESNDTIPVILDERTLKELNYRLQ